VPSYALSPVLKPSVRTGAKSERTLTCNIKQYALVVLVIRTLLVCRRLVEHNIMSEAHSGIRFR
jgi:hypothetical protein